MTEFSEDVFSVTAERNFGFIRSHLRADEVVSWIHHDLRVQDVSRVLQSPLSCRNTTGGQTIITAHLLMCSIL